MLGEAVGKGLDIKGKSSKRGKLSGYVVVARAGMHSFMLQTNHLNFFLVTDTYHSCRSTKTSTRVEFDD